MACAALADQTIGTPTQMIAGAAGRTTKDLGEQTMLVSSN